MGFLQLALALAFGALVPFFSLGQVETSDPYPFELPRTFYCRLENNTPFAARFTGHHFAWGEFDPAAKPPPMVQPHSSGHWGFRRKIGSLDWIAGGVQWSLLLPDQKPPMIFAVGFTRPWIGTVKSGVAVSGDAYAGYEAARDEPMTRTSEVFDLASTTKGSAKHRLLFQSYGTNCSVSVEVVALAGLGPHGRL